MDKVFTLEALFAKKGDALLLHYGPSDDPKLIVVDGGPRGVYRKFLRPRLRERREELEVPDDQALPLRMVMVSHIDDDHIAGILDLFREAAVAKEKHRPVPYAIGTLWHNSFDDILGNAGNAVVSRMAATVASRDPGGLAVPRMKRESRAVVSSTAQGRNLRNAAKRLQVETNKHFEGLVMAPAKKISLGHGLKMTVVGPDKDRVAKYQQRWDQDLKKILKKEEESARASAFEDKSPFNLASICVLVEMKRKKILLTGDARGDYVIEGLEKAKRLRKTKPFHVDILKVPHHGSDRNVEDIFFERITADHYVVSGDGEHGNPEREMLEMIQRARGDSPYTIHFTFTKNAHTKEKNKKRKAALRKVQKWVRQKPRNCEVVFREAGGAALSVSIDLLTPLYEE